MGNLFSSTLKMEAIRSSETSVNTTSTRRHIPEDSFLHSHRRENLKSYIGVQCLPECERVNAEMSGLPHCFVLSRLSVNMGECLHNKLQVHLNLMKRLQWPVAGGSSATDAKIVPSRQSEANIAALVFGLLSSEKHIEAYVGNTKGRRVRSGRIDPHILEIGTSLK
jgi:hypothetical protein